MWGSTFTDLAKKAREQADNIDLTQFQTPAVSGLFNLDVLQGGSEEDPNINAESVSSNFVQQGEKQLVEVGMEETVWGEVLNSNAGKESSKPIPQEGKKSGDGEVKESLIEEEDRIMLDSNYSNSHDLERTESSNNNIVIMNNDDKKSDAEISNDEGIPEIDSSTEKEIKENIIIDDDDLEEEPMVDVNIDDSPSTDAPDDSGGENISTDTMEISCPDETNSEKIESVNHGNVEESQFTKERKILNENDVEKIEIENTSSFNELSSKQCINNLEPDDIKDSSNQTAIAPTETLVQLEPQMVSVKSQSPPMTEISTKKIIKDTSSLDESEPLKENVSDESKDLSSYVDIDKNESSHGEQNLINRNSSHEHEPTITKNDSSTVVSQPNHNKLEFKLARSPSKPSIPPGIVQKFMQQIQRIKEHHEEEISELRRKLEEKEILNGKDSLDEEQNTNKFKELQLQEEYYKKLLTEQKEKLQDENNASKIESLKQDLAHGEEREKVLRDELSSEANQKSELKKEISRLIKDLKTKSLSYSDLQDDLDSFKSESLDATAKSESTINDLQKTIKNQNVKLEEERTKVEMFKANLGSLLEKGKEDSTSALNDQKKINEVQYELSRVQKELSNQITSYNELREKFDVSENASAQAQEQYENLKSRVKVVATELKERRQENRDLHTTISNLTNERVTLKDDNEKLKDKINSIESSSSEVKDEIDGFKQQISSQQSELATLKKKYDDLEKVGNSSIQQYKKKAQAALANANARSAAANQAREEMDVEVRALKAASEEADLRAVTAELERKEAVSKLTNDLETLKNKISYQEKEFEILKRNWNESMSENSNLEQNLQDSINEQHRLYNEIEKLNDALKKQKEMTDSLNDVFDDEKRTVRDLTKKLQHLKVQHERSAAGAFLAKQKQVSAQEEKDEPLSTDVNKEDDGAIALLHEELQGANEAVKELKNALAEALLREKQRNTNLENLKTFHEPAFVSSEVSNENCNSDPSNGMASFDNNDTKQTNSSMPLFYAMEKQAELNVARNEINRLASIVSEIESEKRVAIEEKDEMRKKMEESEARLRRHEKLGHSIAARQPPSSTSISNLDRSYGYSDNRRGSAATGSRNIAPSENLNLEYLKNITLRYVKASTLRERKDLIPVIAAVLCLTQEEKQNALDAVDATANLTNVGNNIFESAESTIKSFF